MVDFGYSNTRCHMPAAVLLLERRTELTRPDTYQLAPRKRFKLKYEGYEAKTVMVTLVEGHSVEYIFVGADGKNLIPLVSFGSRISSFLPRIVEELPALSTK
jgi:hypothetical protein